MKKLKYKFIKFLAAKLDCEDLIDTDQYDSVVPFKPFKGKMPEGALTFTDPFTNLGLKTPPPPNFYAHLVDMGLGRPEPRPFFHYETSAPRWDHKFKNGLTLGSTVFYKEEWCKLHYDLLLGEPINIRLIPCRAVANIGTKQAGMPLYIEENLLYTEFNL